MIKSPFPGMDPYLEAPSVWPGVHTALINYLAETLTAKLAPEYVARVEQRVYLTTPGDPDRRTIEPDVHIVRDADTSYAPLVVPGVTPPVFVEPVDLEPQLVDRFVELRNVRSREVVTVIEILSPFNKRPGAQGYAAFQEKRLLMRFAPVHWIEIDLLRAGLRPAEVAQQSDYYVLLKRNGRPRPLEVWFFNLREPLPVIAIPLQMPHPDLPLALQPLLAEVYTRHGFGYDLDYDQPAPSPTLTPADQAWLRDRLAPHHPHP